MIVKELRLKNFISYDDQTISFPTGVIVIVGENGAGKTAILDGITYALFKEHGRGKEENLIRRRFDRAEVRLRFLARGKNYEVIWNLSRNKPARGHLRDLDDDYPIVRPESGERTILPEIEKLIGLKKDIFMNAIYVKQGEIAKLIDAKGSERKKLIGEILGIEVLEEIWKAIGEPIKGLESKLEGYKRDIERLSTCERNLEEKKKELSEKQKKYQEKKEELARLNEELKRLEEEIRELNNKEESYRKIKDELSNLLSQKEKLQSDQQRLEEKVKELERILSELIQYEPHYKDSIKKEEELRSKRREAEELQQLLNRKAELERKKTSYEERARSLNERINEKLESFRKVTNIELENARQLQEFYEGALIQIVEEQAKINEELEKYDNERQRRDEKISSLAVIFWGAFIILLITGAAGLISLAIISALTLILSLALIMKLSKKQKLLEAKINELKQELQYLIHKERDLENFNVSEVLKWYDELSKCEDAISQLDGEIRSLGDPRSRYEALKQDIARIENELDKLRPYVDRYNGAKSSMEREELQNIQELEARVEQLKENKSMINEKLVELDGRISKFREEMERLNYDERIHQDKIRQRESTLHEKAEIQREIGRMEGEIEELSRQIRDLEEEINRLRSSREKCERLENFVNSLRKIRDLFHKDGPLQSAIRSDAASRIESNARRFIEEFSLPFYDIRVGKDFNITVYGRDGDQTLETLSGGEKVAIALIIRLAIAAALAGEELELMIMDEPTIHLDSDRRRELVNLLKKVQKGQPHARPTNRSIA